MRIEALVQRQDGVVTRDQARRCGLSTSTIDRRLACGDWVRRHPRVYADAVWPWTLVARTRAAWLWAGPNAALVGANAAWWTGLLAAPPDDVLVAVAPGRRLVAPAGVRLVPEPWPRWTCGGAVACG